MGTNRVHGLGGPAGATQNRNRNLIITRRRRSDLLFSVKEVSLIFRVGGNQHGR
jgi:hypothetical protein